jgi:hypothetical protein
VGRAKRHQRNALEESKSGPASPSISFDVFLFSLSSPQHTHTHTHAQCVSSSVATGQAPTAKTSPQPMPIGTGGQAVRAFFEQQPAEPERSTLRSFSLSLLFGSFRFFPIATAAAAAAAATQSAPILQVRRQCGAAAYETGGSADENFSNFPATFFISVLFIFTRRHPKFLIF